MAEILVDLKVGVPVKSPILDVRVIALYKGKEPGPFDYLQGMRSGILRALGNPEETEVARRYHRREQEFFELLSQKVPGPVTAVLSPPSDFAWQAEPYREAIKRKFPNAIDLTPAMTRPGQFRAGKGATVDQVVSGLSYQPQGTENGIEQLVIVDDTFTTGTTAAAIVLLLREHGLPEECDVILACPLWLDTVT
ncbi:hypothetical protein [Mesorhizobium sp. M0676]|uniref:hypothetical protein n=1 Tax=Mesorhizobium sp. M0676 TaxID=2956984 RepID=UPI00333D1F71